MTGDISRLVKGTEVFNLSNASDGQVCTPMLWHRVLLSVIMILNLGTVRTALLNQCGVHELE